MHFFSDTPEFDNLELGWRFFRSSWGKGYASEAAIHIKQALSEDINGIGRFYLHTTSETLSVSDLLVENKIEIYKSNKKYKLKYWSYKNVKCLQLHKRNPIVNSFQWNIHATLFV